MLLVNFLHNSSSQDLFSLSTRSPWMMEFYRIAYTLTSTMHVQCSCNSGLLATKTHPHPLTLFHFNFDKCHERIFPNKPSIPVKCLAQSCWELFSCCYQVLLMRSNWFGSPDSLECLLECVSALAENDSCEKCFPQIRPTEKNVFE